MCGPAVATPSVQKALKAALMQRGGQGVRFSEYFKSDQDIADQEDLQPEERLELVLHIAPNESREQIQFTCHECRSYTSYYILDYK